MCIFSFFSYLCCKTFISLLTFPIFILWSPIKRNVLIFVDYACLNPANFLVKFLFLPLYSFRICVLISSIHLDLFSDFTCTDTINIHSDNTHTSKLNYFIWNKWNRYVSSIFLEEFSDEYLHKCTRKIKFFLIEIFTYFELYLELVCVVYNLLTHKKTMRVFIQTVPWKILIKILVC